MFILRGTKRSKENEIKPISRHLYQGHLGSDLEDLLLPGWTYPLVRAEMLGETSVVWCSPHVSVHAETCLQRESWALSSKQQAISDLWKAKEKKQRSEKPSQ